MKIKFEMTREWLRSKVTKGSNFLNFIHTKFGGRKNLTMQERCQTTKEWSQMSRKEREKYYVIKPNGDVKLDYLKKEVGQNGQALALQ